MEVDEETIGDPHQNFLDIMNTVKFLNEKGVIDEAWVCAHREMILKYRTWFPNFTLINPDIDDPTFRTKCSHMETLINHLIHSITTVGRFDVHVYHIFMKNLKDVLEYVFADDILDGAMEMLAIK